MGNSFSTNTDPGSSFAQRQPHGRAPSLTRERLRLASERFPRRSLVKITTVSWCRTWSFLFSCRLLEAKAILKTGGIGRSGTIWTVPTPGSRSKEKEKGSEMRKEEHF